jgi:hypothetical protein
MKTLISLIWFAVIVNLYRVSIVKVEPQWSTSVTINVDGDTTTYNVRTVDSAGVCLRNQKDRLYGREVHLLVDNSIYTSTSPAVKVAGGASIIKIESCKLN